MSVEPFFMLASLLFSIGIVGVVSRRNLFVVYMSIELMLSAISLLLATFSKVLGSADGAVMALLMIGVIASEAALFLAIIVHLYRRNRTIDSDHYQGLRQEANDA
jgi:NADH-quinone oxidoreductase subunit K